MSEDLTLMLLSDERLLHLLETMERLIEEIPPKYVPKEATDAAQTLRDEYLDRQRPLGRPYQDKRWLLRNVVHGRFTMQEVADTFGMHFNTIRYWMDRHGLLVRTPLDGLRVDVISEKREQRQREDEYRRQVIADLYARKITVNQAADICGVAPSTIQQWRRKYPQA